MSGHQGCQGFWGLARTLGTQWPERGIGASGGIGAPREYRGC